MTTSREVAYAIAGAIQAKFKTGVLAIAVESIGSGRLLFSYRLHAEEQLAVTAYSEGFFEDTEKTHLNWIAKRIYEELTQRIKWKVKSKSKG